MADANGSVQPSRASKPASKAKATNGLGIGINGAAIKSPLNGHAVGHIARPARRPRSGGPGALARTLSIAARCVALIAQSCLIEIRSRDADVAAGY